MREGQENGPPPCDKTAQRRAVKSGSVHTGPRAYRGPRPGPCSSGMQAVHRGKTSPSSAAQLPVDAALNAHSLTLLIFWQSGGRDGPFRPGGRHPPCRGGRRQADGLHCLYYTRFAAGVQGAGRTSFPMERPTFRARCPESAAARQKKNGGPCRLGRRFALAGRQGK